ncbi:phage regulatory CII family protein [uncultured Cohaesibacter sp.]|uniref:phage regulatory CII family protein n=1 Tax=uncultured Cohaesibacter sp. TaxID=1002546 RepID=UPI0029C79FA5|nr:phage regulatory CII family protein [uncultured Cohaesibacter sp.]
MPDDDAHDRGDHFAFLVKMAIKASERYDNASVAKKMGLSYHAFHQRLDNKTMFSADEVRRLIASFPDPTIVSYLLRGTEFVAAERITADRSEEEEAIYQAAHRIVFEATDVLRVIDQALADEFIDQRDAASITKEIEEAERSLVSLREFVSARKGTRVSRMSPTDKHS